MSDKIVLRLERGVFSGDVIGVEFARLEKVRVGQEVGKINPYLQTKSMMSMEVKSPRGIEEWSIEEVELMQPYPPIDKLMYTGGKS